MLSPGDERFFLCIGTLPFSLVILLVFIKYSLRDYKKILSAHRCINGVVRWIVRIRKRLSRAFIFNYLKICRQEWCWDNFSCRLKRVANWRASICINWRPYVFVAGRCLDRSKGRILSEHPVLTLLNAKKIMNSRKIKKIKMFWVTGWERGIEENSVKFKN